MRTLNERVIELACHSAKCAPPPAGTGGSVGGSLAHPSGPAGSGPDPRRLGRPHSIPVPGKPGYHEVYDEKGNARGQSSTEMANRYVKRRESQLKGVATRAKGRALTANQQRTFDSIVADHKRGTPGGATQADAARLLKDGLIERVSGKGHGAGNTPLWKLTPAGIKLAGGDAAKGDGRKVHAQGRELDVVSQEGDTLRVRKADGTIFRMPVKIARFVEFANDCHDPKDGRFCGGTVHRKVSRGIMGKGTESHTTQVGPCGKKAADGSDLCTTHQNQAAVLKAKLDDKRLKSVRDAGFNPITKEQARGDSRPVTAQEFIRLATIGRKQLDQLASESSPTTGLDRHWDTVKINSFAEVQKSWGGATIDSHTGTPLPQGANAYAITVKSAKHATVSVPEGASRAEFSKAMDQAKEVFRPILERKDHYLGVFHDDETGRIDIDPVVIVRNRADVDTIGAASHSIGGAYNFSDGNGYWPPHVGGT